MEQTDGSKKASCKEATELLKENSVTKVWYRPNGKINHLDPDSDLALVWLIDGVVLVKELEN